MVYTQLVHLRAPKIFMTTAVHLPHVYGIGIFHLRKYLLFNLYLLILVTTIIIYYSYTIIILLSRGEKMKWWGFREKESVR